jgi:hypothetical protein
MASKEVEVIGDSRMLHTTNPKIKNIFIVSASLSEVIELQTSKLSLLARQAHYARDYNRLAVVGSELMNLSSRSEDVGRYFRSLAARRLGLKEYNETVFEELANRSSLPVRAASTLALGMRALRSKQTDDAFRLFQESYRLSTKSDRTSITTIHTITSVSQLFSQEGSHRESLEIMKAIHPAVREWGRVFPYLLGEQYNNLAYELFKTGQLAEAHYTVNKACAMPIARAYPEWFETKLEIEEKLRETPSRTTVFVPSDFNKKTTTKNNPDNAAEKNQPNNPDEDNLLPSKRKSIEVWLKYKQYTFFLKKFIFATDAGIESFLIRLLEGIDELRKGQSESTLTIHTQLLENYEVIYETENFISRSNFDRLFDYFEELLLAKDLVADAQEEAVEEEVVKEQTAKILLMIEEDEKNNPGAA